MPADYNERKENRIARFRELADKNEKAAEQANETAHKMASVIPFGQPILIGHHSEQRDRNYRDRIHKNFEKAANLSDKAEYYTRRADAAESNRAISSDNPEAVELLKEKLRKAERLQVAMKDANKIIKSKKLTDQEKIAQIIQYGKDHEIKVFQDDRKAWELLQPDFAGRVGFPGYALTNNSAEIRRIKQRIETIERVKDDQTSEQMIGDIRICDSVEDNRIMVFFPGVPDEPIRDYLKGSGFRWSPSNGAWQAYRTAAWKIPGLVRMLTSMPGYVSPAVNS